jgi:Protein tyrosine and serine/threonine kinase
VDYLYFLQSHLNHRLNSGLIETLAPDATRYGFQRLLKLMVQKAFAFPWLRDGSEVLGGGAFGTVVKSTLTYSPETTIAVKLFSATMGPTERSHLFSVYSEVSALDHLTGAPGILPMLDYFVDGSHFAVCMTFCQSTASKWRASGSRTLWTNPDCNQVYACKRSSAL